jgi:hypothetical protein
MTEREHLLAIKAAAERLYEGRSCQHSLNGKLHYHVPTDSIKCMGESLNAKYEADADDYHQQTEHEAFLRSPLDLSPQDKSHLASAADHIAIQERAIAERDKEIERLQEDAVRWRTLVSCERLRFIGSARVGTDNPFICLEAWGKYPFYGDIEKDRKAAVEWLTKFVDGISAALTPPGAT